MRKADRQRELIISIATEPWQHSMGSLAQTIGVDQGTIARDIKELAASGYLFDQDDLGRLFLVCSGSCEQEFVKAPVVRQLAIMRYIAGAKDGKSHAEIISRFKLNTEEAISEKTLERAVKELCQKGLVAQTGDRYKLNPKQVVTELYLEDNERTLLLEALAVAEGAAPLPEEVKSVSSRLKSLVCKGEPRPQAVYVHGRSPMHQHTVNKLCFDLESAARSRTKLRILYRKAAEPATMRLISPLGLVYYWVLDKWYVVGAQAEQVGQVEQFRTYAVDSILWCEAAGENFAAPKGFDLQHYFKYAWGIYKGDEPVKVKVLLRDYYTVPQRVQEELAHRETCVLTQTDAGLVLSDTVQGIEEFAVWLRGFGPGVEVIEPIELRDKVVQELRKTLALYEGVGN